MRACVRVTGEAFGFNCWKKSKKGNLFAFITRTEYSLPDVSCHGYEGKYTKTRPVKTCIKADGTGHHSKSVNIRRSARAEVER